MFKVTKNQRVMQIFKELFRYLKRYISERYINNLTGDFSICFSEHLTGHPTYLISTNCHSMYILYYNTKATPQFQIVQYSLLLVYLFAQY